MKNSYHAVLLGLSIILVPICQGQVTNKPVSKTLIVSLMPGEHIETTESCLAATFDGGVPLIVTRGNNGIYVYEGTQRKGPFASFDKAPIKACGMYETPSCTVYKPDQDADQSKYLQTGNDGMYRIVFNGKTYGPYPFISKLSISKDQSWFVAMCMDLMGKATLITSDGGNISLDGNPVELQVSPEGKQFVVAVKQQQKFDSSLINMDYSKMTVEELTRLSQEMAEKQKNAPPLQSYIYTNDGKKLGPYDLEAFYSDNPCFTITGGNNWIMIINNTLYINGALIKKYDNLYFGPCDVWLSKDGKRYAIATYEKIVFNDGQEFSYPLVVRSVDKDGKSFIQWISLENEKDIVQYSREL